jgi:hypothetical protein
VHLHTTEFALSSLFFMLIIVMVITISSYTPSGYHLSKFYIYAESSDDNNKEKVEDKEEKETTIDKEEQEQTKDKDKEEKNSDEKEKSQTSYILSFL